MVQAVPHPTTHEDLYHAPVGKPQIVDVPPATFLMIDGQGNPNTSGAYGNAIQALYSAAYTIKFALKTSGGPDTHVAPLEGLWWGAEKEDFAEATKDGWSWTMMIRLPEAATAELIADSLAEAARKKPDAPIGELRVESFDEGRAAQVMYLGPYAEEHPTILTLHDFITASGHRLVGRHHEIYLGDPRRSAPEKLRTLIRQPFA